MLPALPISPPSGKAVSYLDALFTATTASATATVGLTGNLTPSLNTFGKILIIVTMYSGHVGPISLAIALGSKNESQNVISDLTEEISIGSRRSL